MSLLFRVLTENHETEGLEAEHGLSVFIQYDGKNYLLDAGQSPVFARNAARLGVDLSLVDAAVLSHAHYDHGDGFTEFFRQNQTAPLYARTEGREMNCYSVKRQEESAALDCHPAKLQEGRAASDCHLTKPQGDGAASDCHLAKPQEPGVIWDFSARYIGIAPEILEQFPGRFCWTDSQREIAPGVWLIPHTSPDLEKIGARTGMYRRIAEEDGKYGAFSESDKSRNAAETFRTAEGMLLVPDDFAHEQSLVFETERGLVIFNSCSHGGVANITEEVRRALPGRRVAAYIGGFHLKAPGQSGGMNCTAQEVEKLGQSLVELGIEHIYTGHCTGVQGYEVLKSVMGDMLEPLATGMCVTL